MSEPRARVALFVDAHPHEDSVADDVVAGLSLTPKRLPPKLFYDAEGSRLFDAICELEEYYPTRTEMAIMRRHIGEMVDLIGPHAVLVEYGSGNSRKTEILLENLVEPAAYVPIDISKEHLLDSADRIAESHPDLRVLPVCADYTQVIGPLREYTATQEKSVVYFPGSTIGNFDPPEARKFLKRAADLVGSGGGMLIGVDLEKSAARLEAAYDDALGVTAAFNRNMLRHINARLGRVFDLSLFGHEAHWNADQGRVEMHLRASTDTTVLVDGREFSIGAGESIVTEHSHKYTLEGFAQLAGESGFDVARVWLDDERLFSVQYLTAR